ncbi:uncharacterized protein LOC131664066 isoform X2 [Phymastichus coffea]|uniref:uncharacterized protein LOC131664066 isoform X2 n=1 Tax=Phymastichus coffea TaxID=108790 RepID=UPI00273BE585|nr:uncharacterized protein LOC131664066 isoform X2 [Phymastichus coffea]
MASFLSGPAAQLVGAGMQAIGVGIPVGETSTKVIDGLRNVGVPVPPKTWFKRKDDDKDQQQIRHRRAKDERSNKTVYDKLEAHVNGVIQVVKPVIELKNLVRENCCKSAERPRRASSQSPTDDLKYYTPQKCSSKACNPFNDQKLASPKRKAANKREKRPCAKLQYNSSDEEEQHCICCSRSRSLFKLPCGRLICSKCDETADHELELNMPRTKTRRTQNPVAIIDLTEDSPSNTSLRLSRIRPRTEELHADSNGDDKIVIPLDDSTEDSDGDVEDLGIHRNRTAIVVNLDDTVLLDDKPSEKTIDKQLVLNESQNKKGSLSCPICFESLSDDNMIPMSTPCGHVYCLVCLKKITEEKRKCALCQRSISLGKCIRLHI